MWRLALKQILFWYILLDPNNPLCFNFCSTLACVSISVCVCVCVQTKKADEWFPNRTTMRTTDRITGATIKISTTTTSTTPWKVSLWIKRGSSFHENLPIRASHPWNAVIFIVNSRSIRKRECLTDGREMCKIKLTTSWQQSYWFERAEDLASRA